MRASLTQPPHWTVAGLPRSGKAFAMPKPADGQQVEVLEDDARPFCPSCASEDTVNYGPHWMDKGSDRWGCGLCGNEFLVVMS